MLELKVFSGDGMVVLEFEHSLRSLSKWESREKKPFLESSVKQDVEMIDYYKDMLLSPVDPSMVYRLEPDQLDKLSQYINDPQSASSVPSSGKGGAEIVTSELIYYWMTELGIDWDAQDWHLNRLMKLVQIINYKRQPEKKKSNADLMAQWNQMNEENQKRFGAEAG